MARIIASFTYSIFIRASAFMLVTCNIAIASTDQSIDQLQAQLIELRTVVDTKSEELSLLRQENKQKRKFMLSQIEELQSSVEHKAMMVAKIDSKLKKNKALMANTKDSDLIVKDLDEAIIELTAYVSNNLPFKTKARLDALAEMQTQLTSKAVSAPRIANKLWAFVEDEIMLTKGNGVYRQIIKLNNDDKLVDVARVGMMMLYYRDGDGNVGMAKKQGQDSESWEFMSLNGKEQIHQIHFLFDSFQKQVRFGEFTLPNTLSGSTIERAL